MGNSFYNGDCAAAAVPSSTCTRPKASTVLSTDEEKNSDCSDCGNISRYLQIFCDSEKTLKSPSKSSIRTTEFLLSTGVLWVLILIRLVRVEVLSLRSFSDPSQRLKAFNSVKYVKWRSRWALLALPCWWCWSLRTNTRHRGNKWWCHRCQTPSSSHHCPGKDLSREKWKNNWNNDLDKKWKKELRGRLVEWCWMEHFFICPQAFHGFLMVFVVFRFPSSSDSHRSDLSRGNFLPATPLRCLWSMARPRTNRCCCWGPNCFSRTWSKSSRTESHLGMQGFLRVPSRLIPMDWRGESWFAWLALFLSADRLKANRISRMPQTRIDVSNEIIATLRTFEEMESRKKTNAFWF